ncbi:hypothetical protein CSAL01_05546 [Colletotrichum salicis]|uniref:Uncharacterized protein n=1 Tax=Colletotrichum salicis TaxID=1209931 RepID=A0A135UZC0_9PEZI|nr:hypothetical protein CSAL01_05546 [Colletotrichum salicis]
MADTMSYDFVPVYMLTKLTKEEEEIFTSAISAPEEDDYLRPKLVHWTSDVDVSVEKDLLPMNKKLESESMLEFQSFFFYADRKSVEDSGTIVAGHDWGTLYLNNMQMSELIDMHGEEIHILEDADWDAQTLEKRRREELGKIKDEL